MLAGKERQGRERREIQTLSYIARRRGPPPPGGVRRAARLCESREEPGGCEEPRRGHELLPGATHSAGREESVHRGDPVQPPMRDRPAKPLRLSLGRLSRFSS